MTTSLCISISVSHVISKYTYLVDGECVPGDVSREMVRSHARSRIIVRRVAQLTQSTLCDEVERATDIPSAALGGTLRHQTAIVDLKHRISIQAHLV